MLKRKTLAFGGTNLKTIIPAVSVGFLQCISVRLISKGDNEQMTDVKSSQLTRIKICNLFITQAVSFFVLI